MWGNGGRSQTSRDEDVHVRVMGALAVGKTTLISTAVTRSPQKRSMPYTRSKTNQRFVCSSKAPNGSVIVAELVDTRGNEPLSNIVNEATQGGRSDTDDEMKSLLSDYEVTWSYMVLFDFSRYETFIYARKVIDKIRAQDAAESLGRSTNGQGRPRTKSIVFLVGNKKEMVAASTLSTWLRDQTASIDSKDKLTYFFAGSALDNAFVCLETPNTEKVKFIQSGLGVPSSDLPHYRFTVDQLLYLIKLRADSVVPVPSAWPIVTSEAPNDDSSNHVKDPDEDIDAEQEITCCWKCYLRCCRRQSSLHFQHATSKKDLA